MVQNESIRRVFRHRNTVKALLKDITIGWTLHLGGQFLSSHYRSVQRTEVTRPSLSALESLHFVLQFTTGIQSSPLGTEL